MQKSDLSSFFVFLAFLALLAPEFLKNLWIVACSSRPIENDEEANVSSYKFYQPQPYVCHLFADRFLAHFLIIFLQNFRISLQKNRFRNYVRTRSFSRMSLSLKWSSPLGRSPSCHIYIELQYSYWSSNNQHNILQKFIF